MAGLPKLGALPSLPELPALPGLGNDLESSKGLYSLAKDSGLQEQADRVVKLHSGEEHKKFFSGGFISDVFDVLNASSYGVVGMLKGKGFAEGIKNRESFADDDTLGQYGLVGVIGGTILDIAVDPLTYIAPWTVLKKVPGFTKVAGAVDEFALGQKITTKIEGTGMEIAGRGRAGLGVDIGDKRVEPLKYLADKVHWMFGQDPVFRETFERSQRNKGIEVVNASNLMQDLAKVDPKIAKGLLQKDDTGRFQRRTLDDIQRELTPEDFSKVAPVWQKIDSLGQELVDLGVLGKGKFEENFGTYIKNAYEEYELHKNKGKKFEDVAKSFGIKGTKGRVEGLTEDSMAKLGQIDDPDYLLFKSMLDMIKDVEDAKLFRAVAKNFATDVEQVGFTKLPDSPRLRTSQGKVAELAQQVEKTNEEIKPLLKQLRSTFKSDKAVLKELDTLEKEITQLGTTRAEELTRFFNYGAVTAKETTTSAKIGAIPEKLTPLAKQVKKYDSFDDLLKTEDGLALEKADIYGELDQYGYRSMRDFYDSVKNPYRAGSTKMRGAKDVPEADKFEVDFGLKKKADDLTPGRARSDADAARAMKKDTKVAMKELDLLAKKIKDFNKGFKAGANATAKEINGAQSQIIKVIKENFDVADQAKFLTKIKNTTSPAKLEEMVNKLADEFAGIQERALEELGMSNLGKAVKANRRIQQLAEKSELLKDIDQKSIANSFIHLENKINGLRFAKEDLMEKIDINKMGDLAGKYIPENMANYIDEMVSAKTPFGARLVGEFKYMKVVLNPATHVRNIMSNLTLNWWKLGIGPWEAGRYAQTIKSAATKDEWYKRAQKAGLGASTYASNELKGLLDDPEALKMMRGAGNAYNKVKKVMGDLYQKEESIAKLTAFRYGVEKKGLKDDEAWKFAESATFNYAQVTPFVRKMRSALWGLPFITFTVKATPIAIETALKAPHRISFYQKMRNSIENLSDDKETAAERETEPDYIKQGFFVKLPMKDEHGRSTYFDMTYVIPFGDLMSGTWWEKGTTRDTALPESDFSAIASKVPAINLLKELAKNQDFSGNRIWKETDSPEQQRIDMAAHVMQLFAPPWVADQMPKGYNESGERQYSGFVKAATADEGNTRRTMYQEMLRLGGFKLQPVDQEIQDSINEFNKKKALQKLLQDNGVVKDFSRVYVPQSSPTQ